MKMAHSSTAAGSWNFLSKCPHQPELATLENSYVHYYSSSTTYSFPRLDLCTEDLGSETGAYEYDITTSFSSLGTSNLRNNDEKAKCSKSSSKSSTMSSDRNFPPPLTTSLQIIRPHREQGRLIIKAVELQSRLRAERSNGRLRLSFYKHSSDQLIMNAAQQQNESHTTKLDNEIDDSDSNNEQTESEQEEEEDDDDDEYLKMEMDKFQRLSRRCNNEGLCNWKSAFWVATS